MKIKILLLCIVIIIIYNIINTYYIYDIMYNYIDNTNYIKWLDKYNNFIYYIQDPKKSEILNCLYISRYMGQDWNKLFLYIDQYNDLSSYCRSLIDYVKKELSTELIINDEKVIKKYNYYQYINELILHTRGCIDLTGSSSEEECKYMENLIEKQTNIKKNMCLLNVDNELCNRVKIINTTPLINGYLDKNMVNFGRDYYSNNRNYHIYQIQKVEDINNDNITIISIISITAITISIVVYNLYK